MIFDLPPSNWSYIDDRNYYVYSWENATWWFVDKLNIFALFQGFIRFAHLYCIYSSLCWIRFTWADRTQLVLMIAWRRYAIIRERALRGTSWNVFSGGDKSGDGFSQSGLTRFLCTIAMTSEGQRIDGVLRDQIPFTS